MTDPAYGAGGEAAGEGGRGPRPPLRILTQSLYLDPRGGVELSTLQDCLALVERGHSIDVMFGTDGSLRTVYEAGGIGVNGPYRFDFSLRGAAVDGLRMIGPARWARRRRPDVLWLSRFEHIIWAQAVSRSAGCPLVCHLHGPPMFNRVRELGRGVSRFLAVSEYIRDLWVGRGLDPHRVDLLYNALPRESYPAGGVVEQHNARVALDLPRDVPIVLCYGQMVEQKGITTLLQALRQLDASLGPPLLLLIDSQPGEPDRAVEKELRLMKPGSYRRYPMTSDVVTFLHACDVVAFPSWLPEAFGRVVVEGMATGRPVVASRVGAVPEILSGEMSRFLVEPRSSTELAHRLASVLRWRDTEPRLGLECSDWIARRFRFGDHVDQLEGVLQDCRRS